MKLLIALMVIAAAVGAGFLASGQLVLGLVLIVPGVLLTALVVVRVVRAVRDNLRSTWRSPLADDPAVARSMRLSAVLVLLLSALPLAAAVGLLYAFGAMVLDPTLDPGPRGASVVGGLFLAALPGAIGGALVLQAVALLRGDPGGGGNAHVFNVIIGAIAGLAVVGALLENREASEYAYNRPGVLLVGSVTLVLCAVVFLTLGMLDNTLKAAEARTRTAPPDPTPR